MDEPLSNLDARLRLRTREEIKRIQRETGITTVFVTHDQEEAMSISDRIVVMKAGVVQQIGKPQEVYDAPVNLFVARFLGTPPINVFEGRVADGALYIGNDRVLDALGQPNRAVWSACARRAFRRTRRADCTAPRPEPRSWGGIPASSPRTLPHRAAPSVPSLTPIPARPRLRGGALLAQAAQGSGI